MKYIRYGTYVVFCLCLFVQSASGQIWQKRYFGERANYTDTGKSIAFDGAGNIYVMGDSVVKATQNDLTLLKYSPAGVLLWAQRIDGTTHEGDTSTAFTVDTAGNSYIAGEVYSGDIRIGNYMVLHKYDPQGNLLWKQQRATPSYAWMMRVDGEGNLCILGNSIKSGDTQNSIMLLKYSPDGTVLVDSYYRYSLKEENVGRFMTFDTTGNIYVVAQIGESTVAIKYNSSGTPLWAYEVTKSRCVGIGIDGSNTLYVGANRMTGKEMNVYKLSSSGALKRKYAFRDSLHPYVQAKAMAVDIVGNVHLLGEISQSQTERKTDILVVKYKANGSLYWTNTYDGKLHVADYATAIALDSTGNVYAAGTSAENNYTRIRTDIVLLKYAPDGKVLSTRTYDDARHGYDRAFDMVYDPAGFIYITGQAYTDQYSKTDIITLKYVP